MAATDTEFLARLEQLITESGMPVADFARLVLGVSEAALGTWRAGSRKVSKARRDQVMRLRRVALIAGELHTVSAMPPVGRRWGTQVAKQRATRARRAAQPVAETETVPRSA